MEFIKVSQNLVDVTVSFDLLNNSNFGKSTLSDYDKVKQKQFICYNHVSTQPNLNLYLLSS